MSRGLLFSEGDVRRVDLFPSAEHVSAPRCALSAPGSLSLSLLHCTDFYSFVTTTRSSPRGFCFICLAGTKLKRSALVAFECLPTFPSTTGGVDIFLLVGGKSL